MKFKDLEAGQAFTLQDNGREDGNGERILRKENTKRGISAMDLETGDLFHLREDDECIPKRVEMSGKTYSFRANATNEDSVYLEVFRTLRGKQRGLKPEIKIEATAFIPRRMEEATDEDFAIRIKATAEEIISGLLRRDALNKELKRISSE